MPGSRGRAEFHLTKTLPAGCNRAVGLRAGGVWRPGQPAAIISACRTMPSACLMLAMSTRRPL